MSWFGLPIPKKDEEPSINGEAPWHIPNDALKAAMSPSPKSSGSESSEKGFYFDPSGLERAAKAVKTLDESKNAKYAYEITKEQERTKQIQMDAQRKQVEAMGKQYDKDRVEKEAQAKSQLMRQQEEQRKRMIQYEDKVKRSQNQDYMAAQRKLKEEELRKQEESLMKQTAIKKEAIRYEAELKKQTEVAKINAETDGKIRYEKENRRIHREQALLQAKEYRDTVLQGITLAGSTIGNGLFALLSDRDRLFAAAGTVSMIALGVYTAKTGTGVAGRFIEARLGKPSLVRETSRITLRDVFTRPVSTLKRVMDFKKDRTTAADDVLKGIVLEDSLEQRMRSIARTAANTKANKAPFRHLLLYGNPGTGKTLYAKALAAHSGMDYAIMTGGDVAPLGASGVTEIHKLFDWAQKSRKGLLVLVDEADAFLQKRSEGTLTAEVRNALNAFLYRTGETSDKFMLVFSSNQPDQFDWAVNDRIDDMVEFKLPGEGERLRMIKQYFEKYIVSRASDESSRKSVGSEISVRDVDEAVFSEMAKLTEGFSGREISKLAIAWQAAAYGSEEAVITGDMMRETLKNHLKSHQQKMVWTKDQKQSVKSADQ